MRDQEREKKWDVTYDILNPKKKKNLSRGVRHPSLSTFKNKLQSNSLAALWSELCALTAKGAGLILGWGTKIPELHGSTETKRKQNKKKPPKSPKIQITMAPREAAGMNPSNRQVCFRRIHGGNSLVVRWLWVHAFTAESPGFISSYRTKIPWAKAKKKKESSEELTCK